MFKVVHGCRSPINLQIDAAFRTARFCMMLYNSLFYVHGMRGGVQMVRVHMTILICPPKAGYTKIA